MGGGGVYFSAAVKLLFRGVQLSEFPEHSFWLAFPENKLKLLSNLRVCSVTVLETPADPNTPFIIHACMENILSLPIHPALGAHWTIGERESACSIGMHWFWWPAIQSQQSVAAQFGRSGMPYDERGWEGRSSSAGRLSWSGDETQEARGQPK